MNALTPLTPDEAQAVAASGKNPDHHIALVAMGASMQIASGKGQDPDGKIVDLLVFTIPFVVTGDMVKIPKGGILDAAGQENIVAQIAPHMPLPPTARFVINRGLLTAELANYLVEEEQKAQAAAAAQRELLNFPFSSGRAVEIE
jgi:hypothetical protein